MFTKVDKNSQLQSNSFYCEYCNYTTSRKSDYKKHLISIKHTNYLNGINTKKYTCNCGKEYSCRQSLWKHNKLCKEQQTSQELIIIEKEKHIQPELSLVMEFVKQQLNEHVESNKINQEIQKQSLDNQMQMFQQMMELMKQQCATTNNINNGQINNNTHFNLQIYLNETCKNAMTVNQFLDYLQPTVEELEATAHLGYVEGISRIIMRGFKNLEEEELPFHCSDLKREHIYVKNPDEEWVEEKDEKPLLLLFIKEVARKNFNNISAWQKQNPNWSNYHSKQNDMFMKILNNSVSGGTEEEQQANYEKIMKNIMKNTVIDKSKKNSK